jgi:hypothetical protein
MASVQTTNGDDSTLPSGTSTGAQWHAAVLRWLESPATWGDGASPVEKIETHISQVFLVGDYVYKLKKPVTFQPVNMRVVRKFD